MSYLEDRVLRTMEESELVVRSDGIVVAVSGGADSVALLTILAGLKEELDLALVVAHFNHRLRGKASDEDARFVSSLAAAHGLPFRSGEADVEGEAGLRGASIEEAARELRYGFLTGCAAEEGAGKIALGHTADDLAETFLMRLLRGAGLGGLVPMEPMMSRGGVSLIRPLLDVSHASVVRHLKESGIPYRLDRTNFSSAHFRNRVRLELIPALEAEYNASIREVLLRTSKGLSVVKSYIEGEAARAYDRRVEEKRGGVYLDLAGLHPAIASLVVRSALRSRGAPYSHEKIEEILLIAREGRGKVDLGRSFRAVAEGERVLLLRVGERTGKGLSMVLAVPGTTAGDGIEVETSIVKKARIKKSATRLARSWMRVCDGEKVSYGAYLDYGSLEGPLVLRTRLPGDRFRPTGTGGERKLKEIFIDEKVPERIRDAIPLLVSGEDIVWIVGYRVGERFKVRPGSKEILKIKVTANGLNM